ncbi:MAG TPA: class F sortase [Chloroflexota bacterium]|nr:class F sortase [Chloroflexota bacterium]
MTPADGPVVRRRTVLRGMAGAAAIAIAAPLLDAPLARAFDDPGADGVAAAADPADSDPAASYEPAVWMRIPRIGVDSATVDVGVINGYYDVPWFDVGHHADSVHPGEPGNSVFNGHVLTIGAGRVFYRLHELEPGDAVFVYTAAYRTGWAVVSALAFADGDDSFLMTTSNDPQLTLYTCTGAFNPLERSYAQRLVVMAELVEVIPRPS